MPAARGVAKLVPPHCDQPLKEQHRVRLEGPDWDNWNRPPRPHEVLLGALALSVLGVILLPLSLRLLFRARKRGWARKPAWWGGILLILSLVFVVLPWQYDAVLMALSPKDFHLTIWQSNNAR